MNRNEYGSRIMREDATKNHAAQPSEPPEPSAPEPTISHHERSGECGKSPTITHKVNEPCPICDAPEPSERDLRRVEPGKVWWASISFPAELAAEFAAIRAEGPSTADADELITAVEAHVLARFTDREPYFEAWNDQRVLVHEQCEKLKGQAILRGKVTIERDGAERPKLTAERFVWKHTVAGPELWLANVRVRIWLGTSHDQKAKGLADALNEILSRKA